MASAIFGSDGVNRSLVNQPKVSRQPAVNSTSGFCRVGLEQHEHRVDHDQRGDHRAHDADDRGEEREDAGCAVDHGRHDLPVTPGPRSGTGRSGRPARDDERAVVRQRQPHRLRRRRSRAARPGPARGPAAAGVRSTGNVAADAIGRSPLTRAAWRRSMLRSPMHHERLAGAGEGPDQPAQLQRVPPRDERQVGVADGELAERAVEDGGDGDPRLVAAPRTACGEPLNHIGHAGPQRPAGGPPATRPRGSGTAARCRRWPSRAARRPVAAIQVPPGVPAQRGDELVLRRRPSPRRRRRSGRRRGSGAGRGRPPGARGRRRPGSSRRRPAGRRRPGRRPGSARAGC